MRHPELHDWSDKTLIGELQSRGVLTAERKTVAMPDGMDAWVKYSTGWLVEDEVFMEGVGE